MPNIYQTYIQIYLVYSQDVQNVQDKCEMPSGRRPKPGPSPGPRTGRPGSARPRAWAGPGRRPLGILYLSCISWIPWIYVDIIKYIAGIFGYIVSIFFVHFYMFYYFSYEARYSEPNLPNSCKVSAWLLDPNGLSASGARYGKYHTIV